MRVVHGLELDARVGAVPRRLSEEVLEGLEHLLEKVALDETCLKHAQAEGGGDGGEGNGGELGGVGGVVGGEIVAGLNKKEEQT